MTARSSAAAAVSAALVCALASAPGSPASARPALPGSPERSAIAGWEPHLHALQRAADAHGGDRTSGTAGYRASLDYVAGRLVRAGYRVERRPFDFRYTEVLEERLTLPDGSEPGVTAAKYSPSTPRAGITARFGAPAGAEEQRRGCAAEAYSDTDVSGRIAVALDGGCPTDAKERAAADAGAAALLVVGTGPGRVYGWLADPASARIPVGGVSSETGAALLRAAADGERGTLYLRSLTETRRTANLLARSVSGDPDHQVIAGAHLDSVPGSPGMNDNGAAAAVLLQTALRRAEERVPHRNQLVFAFWGAEEFGLLGSRQHVASLSARERNRISAYLNLEMIGGPNGGLFVMDGERGEGSDGLVPPPGSAAIADRFARAFAEAGRAALTWPLDGRSDYAPFMRAGIPAGGLNGGSFERKSAAQQALWGGSAGEPFDPCYHRACDTTANVDPGLAGAHGAAFAKTLAHFADARPPRHRG